MLPWLLEFHVESGFNMEGYPQPSGCSWMDVIECMTQADEENMHRTFKLDRQQYLDFADMWSFIMHAGTCTMTGIEGVYRMEAAGHMGQPLAAHVVTAARLGQHIVLRGGAMQRTAIQSQTTYLQQALEGALHQPLLVLVRLLDLTLAKHQLVAVHVRQPLKVHLVGNM